VAGVRGGAEVRRREPRDHTCPGTRHGFHNNSTPRYNEAAAKLAWERTVAFFRKHLA
jgi:dienelactone hydrolase